MANGSNRTSDILKTAVVTLALSGTLFYILGTMKNGESGLRVSSETYGYGSDGIHIFTDAPDTEAAVLPTADEQPESDSESADYAACDDSTVPETEFEAETETETETVAAVPAPNVPAAEMTDAVTEAVSQQPELISATVYWVKNGEVWHITDKCSSLSRSKKIFSGQISDAQASGKSRVCKICGD